MDVRYAKATSHVASPTGITVFVILGTHWPADDPIVKQHPDLFTDDPMYGLYFTRPPQTVETVHKKPETATAGPGERRSVPRGG